MVTNLDFADDVALLFEFPETCVIGTCLWQGH